MSNFKEFLKELYCEAGLAYLVRNVDAAVYGFQLKNYTSILISELEKGDLTIPNDKVNDLLFKAKLAYSEHFENVTF